MKILVCVKLVAQSTFTDALGDSSGERLSNSALVMNPTDETALEYALKLKDKDKSIKISVITMAPQSAAQMLQTALAKGADQAFHICDKAFAGSDTIATVSVLSRAAALTGTYDLILCGKNSLDSETGHIGPQMAALMGLPFYSNVVDMASSSAGLSILRAAGTGFEEYTVNEPAVVSVVNGTCMIRQPSVMGYKLAKGKQILMLDSGDIAPARSGTDTIQVTEKTFSHRHGVKTDNFAEGISALSAYIKSVHS